MRLTARITRIAAGVLTSLLVAAPAYAQEAAAPAADSGDTAWVLMSTALVLLMTAPGLALFYGGLVSRKNVLSTLMHSFFTICLVGVQWVLIGYTVAFGSDKGGILGGLDFLGLSGVGMAPNGAATVPHLAFAIFQGVFAIITVALITGAFAERMKFGAYVLFSLLWATLVYGPLAHWVWGGGWLQKLGALDFAGGLVVHISSGVSALVAAVMVGKRYAKPTHPHNIPYVMIGGGLLFFGWLGFNGGSALGANGLAALAVATTFTSGAAGGLLWTLFEWNHRRKPSLIGTVSGVVAGLVGITPAAGYVSIPAALAIGATTAVVCYLGVNKVKAYFGYDDALDVFGVHGLGGIWGALSTGLFASSAINPAGADGLIFGNAALLGAQAVSVLAAVAFSVAGTFLILKVVSAVTALRASQEEEQAGLDRVLHGEVAYTKAQET